MSEPNAEWHEQRAKELRAKAKPTEFDDLDCSLTRRIRRLLLDGARAHEAEAERLRRISKKETI